MLHQLQSSDDWQKVEDRKKRDDRSSTVDATRLKGFLNRRADKSREVLLPPSLPHQLTYSLTHSFSSLTH